MAGLLWHVMREATPQARLLTMFQHASKPASIAEKVGFGARLSQIQVAGRTDWVLFSHLGLAQVQNLLPSFARRRYAVFLHGIEAWNTLSRAETRALANADLRIANSAYTARRVVAAHPAIGPVEPCPLALLPRASTATARARTLSPDLQNLGTRVVLLVGRMSAAERYKGHDEMLDAWPAVVSTVPDAHLVIVGDGDDGPRLRAKGAGSVASHSITFCGFLDEGQLQALYSAASVFALPSRGEGFGLVYLEAMSHALPCVGSVHDAAAEVINDGETGRLVDPLKPTALAEALVALLRDDAMRRRMGEAGRARLHAEFSFERFRNRLLHLLPAIEGRSGTRSQP